jgi:manganese transport protein
MINQWGRYLRRMGPAWVISAVACGPATLASVSLAGASYGYELLWVVILSAVFGATAQYLAARAGIIEGKGIIAATEARLGRVWAWVLTIDAVLATYLAAIFLMNALVGVTGLVTGLDTPWWGVSYALIIGLGLIQGGYGLLEKACKTLVALVVVCFLITLFQADLSPADMARGLLPGMPPDVDAALMIAAIMGGAVHITIIGMHTYNTNARGWTKDDLGLARFDTVSSMGVAFGLYSLAIFLVAAAVLHPHGIKVKSATDAALSLGPLLGSGAMTVFLAGLWAATFSTILPTFLAGIYFIFDLNHWPVERRDPKFIVLAFTGAGLSALGPFIKGSFFLLLPVMLAIGLCGTPLIIVILLYLLNSKKVAGFRRNSWVLNILGVLTLAITSFAAIRFILSQAGLM